MSVESENLHKEALAKVEARAERMLNDDKFPWLRSHQGSRFIVVTTFLTILAYSIFSIFEFPILAIIALLLVFVHLGLLRLANRNVTEWPDEFLDERLRSYRNRAYRHAYIGVIGLFALLLVLAVVINGFDLLNITVENIIDAGFGLFFLNIAAPSMTYAWIKTDN